MHNPHPELHTGSTLPPSNPPPPAKPAPTEAAAPLPSTVFQLKRCRTCGEERPLQAFGQVRGRSQWRRPDCRDCSAAHIRHWRKRARQEAEAEEELPCRHCTRLCPATDFTLDRRAKTGRGSACAECREQRAAGLSDSRGSLNQPDELICQNTRLYERRVKLGIAIAYATCSPGQVRSREEIAAYAGVTPEVIRRIELQALEKMRVRARQLLAQVGLEEIVKGARS